MRLRKALLGISLPSSNSTRENKNNDHRRRLEPLVQIDRGGDPVIRETVHIIPHSTIDEEDSARKLALREQKQQCLVFYNHSLKCNHGGAGNKCPKLGTWCAKQKELSKHLAQCDKVICSFPNCYLSRQVLHHYLSCKDKSRCHLCTSAQRQMILLDNQILARSSK